MHAPPMHCRRPGQWTFVHGSTHTPARQIVGGAHGVVSAAHALSSQNPPGAQVEPGGQFPSKQMSTQRPLLPSHAVPVGQGVSGKQLKLVVALQGWNAPG